MISSYQIHRKRKLSFFGLVYKWRFEIELQKTCLHTTRDFLELLLFCTLLAIVSDKKNLQKRKICFHVGPIFQLLVVQGYDPETNVVVKWFLLKQKCSHPRLLPLIQALDRLECSFLGVRFPCWQRIYIAIYKTINLDCAIKLLGIWNSNLYYSLVQQR